MSDPIPVVFAFDENYKLPAWIAIKSLLDTAEETEYDIFVLHEALSVETKSIFDNLTKINWIQVSADMFKDVPTGWSGLPTYFRLVVHDLIPQYDKIVWSDVDVLFKRNLSNIYQQDVSDVYWAGIKAEINNPQTKVHNYFPENKNEFIYMPGFMLINTAKMRENNMTQKFFNVIRKYGKRLSYFDLDVLNLACDKIGDIPFEYCVLENIYDTKDITSVSEYLWLSKSYSHDELENAKKDPAIIHYAGKTIKIWRRKKKDIPEYYLFYMNNSPLKVKFRSLKKMFLFGLSKFPFKKATRRKFRQRGESI